MRILTIGFTRKTAEEFFGLLQKAGVKRVVDVRLGNASQLAGFSKKNDLAYFLRELGPMGYAHVPQLAPTKDMLDAYRKKRCSWEDYETRFVELMKERRIEEEIDPVALDDACLLCSEHRPHRCHRRLVAEYLSERWGNVEIEHLGAGAAARHVGAA